ncbi:MAG: spore coat protein CotJB [Bacilli bacterium]|nr:spore coat protein CotJB [Bacilli bacterium]
MNEYGFDYMNYITSIPNSMDYNQQQKSNLNYSHHQKNNMGYITSSHNMPNMAHISNMMTKNNVLEPNEGFMRGNLFANQYDPYKNYKPASLEPKDEKEALLYQVMQYKFALNDLDLYLDTHPNNTEMINLYNKYLNTEKQMCDKYESMYGPLTLDSNYLNKNTWVWNNRPWPWEGV